MNFWHFFIFLSNRKFDVLVISLGELVKGKSYFWKLEISEVFKIDSFQILWFTDFKILTYIQYLPAEKSHNLHGYFDK